MKNALLSNTPTKRGLRRGLKNEIATVTALAAAGSLMRKRPFVATALGICAGVLRLMPASSFQLKNRVVLITGGSRGLGMAIAQQCLREEADVAILARDQEEIDRARIILEEMATGRVLALRCDITEPADVKTAVQLVEEEFGRIDVLVNNAGTITVGPFESMDASDYEAMMRVQLHAVVNLIQEVIPVFLKNGHGRIVNISSIGGRVPVPHMSSYCAGKYALAGFSEALGPELAEHNIHVTTVYPGLMRTGSPIQAVFKGDCEKEYAWFQSLDVSPLSVCADYAARQIVQGVKHGDTQVVFPFTSKIAIGAQALFPETYAYIARQCSRFMPSSDGGKQRQTGAQSKNWLEMQSWYQPLKKVSSKAEAAYNQKDKADADFNLGVNNP